MWILLLTTEDFCVQLPSTNNSCVRLMTSNDIRGKLITMNNAPAQFTSNNNKRIQLRGTNNVLRNMPLGAVFLLSIVNKYKLLDSPVMSSLKLHQ